MKNVFELNDLEIEDCIDGSTNIDMIKEIFTKPYVVTSNGLLNPSEFANWFAYGIRGYIDADEDSPLWLEYNDLNTEWGLDIATNINEYITGDE
jgi:hypothetical protein